jgi:hypothetical protein
MKVLMILVVLFISGCMLDETNQEDYQGGYSTPSVEVEVIVIKKVYVDENNEIITDPERIEEIESN